MDQPAPMVTVAVIAPDERISELLAALDAPTIDVVGSTDAAGAVAVLAEGAVDIVVTTTGSDELSAAGTVAAASPATRVVAVGAAEADALVTAWVGSVVADDNIGELANTVLGLSLGESRIDAAFASHLVAQVESGNGLDPLSDTEREVLNRLAAGDDVDTISHDYAVPSRMVRLVTGGVVARVLLG